MSLASKGSALAPFRMRTYRFQWPADMAVCWGFEMELLILSWYILVETQSVLMLTVFGALQYVGTLIAPMFGVVGDRVGHRRLLCGMRGCYLSLSLTMMGLVFAGVLVPWHVFVIATLLGIVRTSDLAVRSSLIGESMPPQLLVRATSVARTTTDTARILGALVGAALVAALGMGPAYVMIACLYGISLALISQAGRSARSRNAAAMRAARTSLPSAFRDLREGFGHVWETPHLLAVMCLAFLANLTAFPLMNNLMPYVAKEVYGTDQRGLGYLIAGCAFGALLGSIVMSRMSGSLRAARMIVIFLVVWHVLLVVFSRMPDPVSGFFVLIVCGFAQSLTMIPMSSMLLRTSDPRLRGRVMGIRMFAIYALPIGLLCAGPLIKEVGYSGTAAIYCAIGIAFTLLVAYRWRADLWSKQALANVR
jgi:predicted MFS family arabinose efflux permease